MEGCDTEDDDDDEVCGCCDDDSGGGGGGKGGGNLELGKRQCSICKDGGKWASGIVGGDGRLLGDIASDAGVPAASSSCCTKGRVSGNLRNCCNTSGSSSAEHMLHRSSRGPGFEAAGFCESCNHKNQNEAFGH